MLGAIAGDVIGSVYEFNNLKSKEFPLFRRDCRFTDDTVMTCGVAKAILDCKGNYRDLRDMARHELREVGRPYPYCGYGGRFIYWMYYDAVPYNSCGNGSAMRVSACGWAAKSIEEAKELALKVTDISHDHPEGIKAAESVAVAIYMALHGSTKEEIKEVILRDYYDIDFTLDEVRDDYQHVETAQDSVPYAFEAFFEGKDFEDVIRCAVSVGGDSDTIADIAGAMAEAYYGIPKKIRKKTMRFLDARLLGIVKDFEKEFPAKIA